MSIDLHFPLMVSAPQGVWTILWSCRSPAHSEVLVQRVWGRMQGSLHLTSTLGGWETKHYSEQPSVVSTDKLDVDLCLGTWDTAQGSIFYRRRKALFLRLVCICWCLLQSLALILECKLQPGLSVLASSVLLMSIWPELTDVITT